MLTVSVAAKKLGVSHGRVLQFIASGRLRADRVSPRLYLIDPKEIRRFASIPRPAGRKKLAKSR